MLSDGRFKGVTLTSGSIAQMYHYDPISWTECEVWNAETATVEVIALTHDYQPGLNLTATVDATPEIRALAREWQARKLIARVHAEDFDAWHEAVLEAHRVRKGTRVEVVKGRKYVHGTTGEVFWAGPSLYGDRVGVHPEANPDETMWLAATNVRAVDVDAPSMDEYTCTDEEALEIARERVARMYPDPAPIHTVRGEPIGPFGLPYGTTHDMSCPGCADSPFTSSPRSETYWTS